ncbi:LysR family transcriptional regulator [Echinimonas agarilytica]|uniref:LysR substrate-binding domain-containing protein n=1 Tax=Echinimonas agarilytica TaxID=1215918 RepID=A0AA42B753_9GAMM|nr:LysR family transcriptional regulator [Echinimonas agarilytica]MCM2679509.1 LysR substrate-binding domain-containing protein [Echinimonas agarilytica]
MNQFNINGISEFIVVAEVKSFTEAAERLSISRPRVSQIIARLEQTMGVRLIERTTRSMQLTDAGERFYQHASRAIEMLHQAQLLAVESSQHLSGRLRINSVGGKFGEELLAPLILQFSELHPHIDVHLDFASHHVDIIAEQYDLAIRMGMLGDSSLVARPLAHVNSYLCASPSYIEQHGTIDHPKQLNQHQVIHGSVVRWAFNGPNQQRAEITVKGKFICPNGHVQRAAALSGKGVARLPGYYVETDIRKGRLVNVLEHWHSAKLPINIVYPKPKFRQLKVQRLIEFLIQQQHRLGI